MIGLLLEQAVQIFVPMQFAVIKAVTSMRRGLAAEMASTMLLNGMEVVGWKLEV